MTWGVDGFVADELIGIGASGEVWRGRDTASGEVVALKRLRVGADAAAAARLVREAGVLAAFGHRHVVALRAVLPGEGGLVLVLDFAEGGSLAALLAARGRLTPGEAVTAVAPVAAALAEAHAHGLVHGDVSPANVLLTRDGRPLLADLGTARLIGEAGGVVHGTVGYVDPRLAAGAVPGPASDVFALGVLAACVLTGAPPTGRDPRTALVTAARAAGVPPALLDAVLAAIDPEPAARPSAAEFAAALRGCAVAAPLPMPRGPAVRPVLPGADGALTHAVARPSAPASPTVSGRHRTAAPRRGRVAALAVRVAGAGAALTLAVAAGLAWTALTGPEERSPAIAAVPSASASKSRPGAAAPSPSGARPARPSGARPAGPSGARPAAPSRAPAAAGPQWEDVLASLDQWRAAAFAAGDASLLGRVYAPGSAAAAADRALIRTLHAGQATAAGLRHEAVRIDVRSRAPQRAVLRVVDRMSAYEIIDARGRVLAEKPARGERPMSVELVKTADGWRIADLTAPRATPEVTRKAR